MPEPENSRRAGRQPRKAASATPAWVGTRGRSRLAVRLRTYLGILAAVLALLPLAAAAVAVALSSPHGGRLDGEVEPAASADLDDARGLDEPTPDHPSPEATDGPGEDEEGAAPRDAGAVPQIQVLTEVVDVPIERGEQYRETDELIKGDSRIEREGEDGLRQETYRITLVDGEETERELVGDQIIRGPTDRVVLVGTAPNPVEEAQRRLSELGYPVGAVDGIEGPMTQRALCAWRRLEGHEASRRSLQDGELEALEATTGLPGATAGRGVTVDRTCQTLYYRDGGRWQHVYPASTGADGLPRPGDYRIQRERPGWHTSTLYPAPEPNMYNSLYFRGAIAIHGSNHVPPHPASKGCVRVTPAVADVLFAALDIGDPVLVIGDY